VSNASGHYYSASKINTDNMLIRCVCYFCRPVAFRNAFVHILGLFWTPRLQSVGQLSTAREVVWSWQNCVSRRRGIINRKKSNVNKIWNCLLRKLSKNLSYAGTILCLALVWDEFWYYLLCD